MCGLFGFAGTIETDKRIALLRALCILNADRGEDSVGLACVNRRDDMVSMYREAIAPESAVNQPRFVEVCDDIGQIWIGHTRMATRGTVCAANAHPFHIGDIVGAHNGVIAVTNELISRCDSVDYPVDSQYLFHLLNRDGCIGGITGCAALVWCDMRNVADVSFIRHHNPLWIATAPDSAWIAWSSEWDSLRHGLAIAGIMEYETIEFQNGKQIDVCLVDGRVSSCEVSDNGIVSLYQSVSRTPSHGCAAGWDIDTMDDIDISKPYNGAIALDIGEDDPHADLLARLEREDAREYFGRLAENEDDYVTEDELAEMDSNDYRLR